MKKYDHLFFDLDRTLWDFERNMLETFKELYSRYNLKRLGCCSFDQFVNNYREHNLKLWELYRNGEIEKDVLSIKRFKVTLNDFGIDDPMLTKAFAEDYLELSPLKTNLFPYTHEILAYLKSSYHLHIITNGFKEVQDVKVKTSGLDRHFENIITSEEAGYKKPDIRIFNYALNMTGAKAVNSLMIGDDLESDIEGARNAGIDQVLINHEKIKHNGNITYVLNSLEELKTIL